LDHPSAEQTHSLVAVIQLREESPKPILLLIMRYAVETVGIAWQAIIVRLDSA